MRYSSAIVLTLLCSTAARADDFPRAVLKNERLSLTVYLPDASRGFYRGTRFDWAGVVGDITFAGHRVFGPWKDAHDPANHDDIVGPVEEFGMEAPLGYATAKEGETFLKIGVGELVKPKEDAYRFYHNYTIRRPGTWEVTRRPNEVTFQQEITSPLGYGYRYAKRVTLDAEKPVFVLHHELTNTGTQTIDTNEYNHNFFNVDDDPVGPNYRIAFHASPRVTEPKERFQELVTIHNGRELAFAGPLDRGSVWAALGGLAGQKNLTFTHAKSGIVLSVDNDAPFEKVNVWGMSRTICAEPFLRLRLRPDESKTWSVRYTFGIENKR